MVAAMVAAEAVGVSELAAAILEEAVSAEWAAVAFAAEWVVLTAASRFARRQWGDRSQLFTRPGSFTRREASLREISQG